MLQEPAVPATVFDLQTGEAGVVANTVLVALRSRLGHTWCADQRLPAPKLQAWSPHADGSSKNNHIIKGGYRVYA